jgi:uncharacterized protein (UPF0335 family)
MNQSEERIRQLATSIARMQEQVEEINADIKAALNQAKSEGFDVKLLRIAIKEYRMDGGELAQKREAEAVLDGYRKALGLLEDLPLGQSAMASAARHLRDAGVSVSFSGAQA